MIDNLLDKGSCKCKEVIVIATRMASNALDSHLLVRLEALVLVGLGLLLLLLDGHGRPLLELLYLDAQLRAQLLRPRLSCNAKERYIQNGVITWA